MVKIDNDKLSLATTVETNGGFSLSRSHDPIPVDTGGSSRTGLTRPDVIRGNSDPNDGSDITSTGDNNQSDDDVSTARGGRGDGTTESSPTTDGRRGGYDTSVDISSMVEEMVGSDATDPSAYSDALKGLLSTLLGQSSDFGDLAKIIKGLQNAFSGGMFGELSDEDKVSLSTTIGSMVSNVMTGMLNNAYNRQNWVMENAYNTPAAQVQRLIDAGINPAYYFGSLNAGNASQIGQSSLQAGQQQFAHNAGTNAGEKFTTALGGISSLVGSALGVAEAPSTIKGLIASANLASEQANALRQMTPVQVENFMASSAAAYAQARNLDSSTSTNEATRPLTLAQMRENVANIRSNTEKMDTESKLNKQQIDTNFLYQKRQAEANLGLTESQKYLARVNAETLREGMEQRWAQMFQDKEIAQGNWATSRYVADKNAASAKYVADRNAQSASTVANINGRWQMNIAKLTAWTNRANTLTMADVQREGIRKDLTLPFINKLYDHVQTTWYVGADGSMHSAAEMKAKFPGIFSAGGNVSTALEAKGFKQTTLEQNCFNLLKLKAVRDGIKWYLSKSPDFNLDWSILADSEQMLVHYTNLAQKQYNLQLGNKIGYGFADMLFNGTGQSSAQNSFLGGYGDLIK